MPITETGYQRRTRDVVLASIQEYLRDKIDRRLDLSDRAVLGNSSNLDADGIDQLEQLIEECYNAFDPDNASDDRYVTLSLLRGVPRNGSTHGLVGATLTLGTNFVTPAAPGSLAAHVINTPTNRWLNRDIIDVDAILDGVAEVVFESELPGSLALAEAGTLTVIATPVTGWVAVTNADAATPGTDIESIPALRIRGEVALSARGSRTRGAIRSKLVLIDGVLSAEVFENVTNSTDADGIGAHNIRPVIWDGSPAAADDDQIAQVIYDVGAEGILSQGSESGTAQDPVNGPQVIAFDRAEISDVTVSLAIQSTTGVNIDDVRAAILAVMPTRVGRAVIYNRLEASVFRVPGVDNHSGFLVNGGTADLPAVQSTIYLLDADDITVTGDVS